MTEKWPSLHNNQTFWGVSAITGHIQYLYSPAAASLCESWTTNVELISNDLNSYSSHQVRNASVIALCWSDQHAGLHCCAGIRAWFRLFFLHCFCYAGIKRQSVLAHIKTSFINTRPAWEHSGSLAEQRGCQPWREKSGNNPFKHRGLYRPTCLRLALSDAGVQRRPPKSSTSCLSSVKVSCPQPAHQPPACR